MTQERNNELPTMEDPLDIDNSSVVEPVSNTPFMDGSLDGDSETEAVVSTDYILPPETFENTERTECGTAVITHKYIQKFRTAVLVVQVIRNLIKIYRDYAASRTEPISFSEYVGIDTETENLLFDRSLFKAKMEMILSSEAKQVLSSPPKKRTIEEAKLAMLSLRTTVSSFAAYPVHVQENLAQVGWYECFGPGRVIIRQGHVAQNFYLILSGTAVVTKVSHSKKTGELFSKTVALLKKGKYFGDFLNIFLNSESQEGPDHLQLLQSIDLLSGWPIDKLPYNNPRICVHTFYRPGTVITKDSKASSKIYVIKSGSVRVLKAVPMQKTPPFLSASRSQSRSTAIEESKMSSPVQNRDEYEDPPYNFTEEEHLLPLLQKERKLNETARTSAQINKGVMAKRFPLLSNTAEDERIPQLFIHIQTLRAGEVFGLVYTIYEDTLGMALVSDGAECIVISKEFFKKQMDDAYLHKLSRHIQPYPTKEILQQKMHDYMRWQDYKSQLIRKHH
ncbi:cyclic nucleotide-binding domain-containing protein 2-like isoform X2 [Lithobates pipiens]